MEKHQYAEVRKVINDLLRKSGEVIPKQQIIDLARNEGIEEVEVIKALKHFVKDGTLVEIDKESVQVPV